MADEKHVESVLKRNVCPTQRGKLIKVGIYGEMGRERAAFDEGLAKQSIDSQGFYRFAAKSFDPLAERPLAMP